MSFGDSECRGVCVQNCVQLSRTHSADFQGAFQSSGLNMAVHNTEQTLRLGLIAPTEYLESNYCGDHGQSAQTQQNCVSKDNGPQFFDRNFLVHLLLYRSIPATTVLRIVVANYQSPGAAAFHHRGGPFIHRGRLTHMWT